MNYIKIGGFSRYSISEKSMKTQRPALRLVRIVTVPISLEKLLVGQMKYMGEHQFEVFMISANGDNVELLERREDCTFIPVEMTRKITPLKDIISLYRLISVLRKLKPQIVHTQTLKGGLLGMLAARFVNVPIRLHTVGGMQLLETPGWKGELLKWIEKLTYACATKVFPNSKELADFVIKSRFCKPRKIHVIGNGSSNGIDTGFYQRNSAIEQEAVELRRRMNIKPSDFVFIFIGRLVRDKGIEELVEAFVALQKKYKDIRLLLIGSYESDLDPLSLKTRSDIEEHPEIIHDGFKDDVRPYLAMSQALTFPTYREGFPNVPMQAGCFGLPSIVTDINGCREIVIHKRNGLIIPSKNAQALEEAMEMLLMDKELYSTMQSNARKMIVERYEQKHFWSLLLNEYRKQLKVHDYVSQVL